MDELEFAYYLDGQQLLLLLSLIDQRPVVGLPEIGKPENWRQVSLPLLQNGWLSYEGGQLVMDARHSAPLLAMKDAARIYAIYGKRPLTVNLVLYDGAQPALLEFMPDGKFRLHLTEEETLRRIVGEVLICAPPMPEELTLSLPDDVLLRECLEKWRTQGISFTDTPGRWLQLEEVRGVLEIQTPETQTRWIWIEEDAADIVVRQDRNGIWAWLDTVSQRKRMMRELELEP